MTVVFIIGSNHILKPVQDHSLVQSSTAKIPKVGELVGPHSSPHPRAIHKSLNHCVLAMKQIVVHYSRNTEIAFRFVSLLFY